MREGVLFLLLAIGLPVISGWTLTLSPTEERLQNRRAGDNFLCVCKVKDFDGAASDVKIEWYKDRKIIPRFGSTMTIERTYSNQLMMNRPKVSDGGKYTCKAEVTGETQEVSADISFVDPPKFIDPQEEQHPEEGTRAEIICQVEGTDQLEVFWQFNGVTLDETSQRGYEFSENNQILYIPHFTSKIDDGIYKCNAAQYSSFETLSLNVTGYARPTITVFDVPNGNRGVEGHTIELKCGAVGKPKPTYKWFFENDEVPIVHSDKHNVDEGLLIIESLNSEDAGNYKCVANNSVGTNERNFDLVVFLKPKVDLKHEHIVKEGEDVELVCSYHGEGHVTAKFISGSHEYSVKSQEVHKTEENDDSEETTTSSTSEESTTSDEVELHSDEDKSNEDQEISHNDDENNESQENQEEHTEKRKRFADDENRISVRAEDKKLILTIKSVSLEDSADYTCAVSNDAGTTNRVSHVGIVHPPTLRHYTGPHIRSYLGNTVSIYCDVSAVPSPKWHWYKDNKEVEANGASVKIDTQGSSTRLTLENFEEGTDNFGVYTCKAENEVGQLEKQIEVIKVVKPSTPVGMDCKKMLYPNYGKCSFDLETFEKEESKPQTMDFLIAKFEEMESDYKWSDAKTVSVPFEEEITIPDLDPSTQYVVKVRATNEAGSSEYSEEISFETIDPWAPQSPAHVEVACSDYCTVSWNTPNSHGSPISKYRVSVQEMQLKSVESSKEDSFETENEKEETTNSEEANSSEHEGEAETESTTAETETETTDHNSVSREDEEESTTSSSEVDNEQDDVSLEHDSAEILPTDPSTSSEHRGSEMVAHGSLQVIEVDATENQLQLTSLKPHSYYKISVAAENAIGQGEPAEIEYQTDESPTKYDEGIDSVHLAVGIFIVVVILLLFIDLGCYVTNRCGLISCICLNLCGRNSGAKQNDIESGRGGPESSRLLEGGTRFSHPLTTTV